jgi:hypothetical protein
MSVLYSYKATSRMIALGSLCRVNISRWEDKFIIDSEILRYIYIYILISLVSYLTSYTDMVGSAELNEAG